MCGWLSEASTRASRSKRASRSGSFATSVEQHLDRHLAPEPGVAGAVHLAHASRAERREDLVVAQDPAGLKSHELVRILPSASERAVAARRTTAA